MASLSAEAPDPKAFKSWEDAFKYPIPAVRRMQQQLRGDIGTNRERLRTLVGTSYRDLLGTADSIVHMDAQMRQVEAHLGDTSRRCNTHLLSKSCDNGAKLRLESQATDRQTFVTASQLTVFCACPEVLARTLRRSGSSSNGYPAPSLLLGAKVLVVSRLLNKQLSSSNNGDTESYVNPTRARLGKLRKRFLAAIDHRLAGTNSVSSSSSSSSSSSGSGTETARLVDAMCAYALATSTSSSLDILKHFHGIRLEAISTKLKSGSSNRQSVLEALRLWIRTLQDTRILFPKALTAAVARLREGPLLADEDIGSVVEFDLDVHARWLGQDLRNFVPYVRKDDMTVGDASRQLSSWAPAALRTLLANLKGCLGEIVNLSEVIELRKSCLELLFTHYHIAGVRRNGVLNGFREAFERRILDIVKQRCEELSGVSADVSEILEEWESHNSQESLQSLWDASILSKNTGHGARDFRKSLVTRVHGQTNASRMVTEHYRSWLVNIEEVDKSIEAMKDTKWEDQLDELLDESESEEDEDDEATLSKIKILLKEKDPSAIQHALSSQLATTFESFKSFISSSAASLGDDACGQAKSSFLIRVLRDIKSHLPATLAARKLDIACIPTLHSIIATPAVDVVASKYERSVAQALRRKSPSGRAVWDGDPNLPVLPSPWAFRLLKDLEGELAGIGTDIWTPDAKVVMKALLRWKLLVSLQKARDACASKAVNGTRDLSIPRAEKAKDEKGKEKEKQVNGSGSAAEDRDKHVVSLPTADAATQMLFDIGYIDATSSKEDGAAEEKSEDLEELRGWLQSRSGLSKEHIVRIAASAEGYRKRTALLFALSN